MREEQYELITSRSGLIDLRGLFMLIRDQMARRGLLVVDDIFHHQIDGGTDFRKVHTRERCTAGGYPQKGWQPALVALLVDFGQRLNIRS
jgi:hypothetical protein